MVWVTGGNPMGNAERTPPAVPLENSWPLGTPDLVVPMPSAFTIAADKTEETLELTLPTGATEARLAARRGSSAGDAGHRAERHGQRENRFAGGRPRRDQRGAHRAGRARPERVLASGCPATTRSLSMAVRRFSCRRTPS